MTKENLIVVKIGAGGRITIPKAIRERLDLRPGTELMIEERGNAILLRRAMPTPTRP